MEGDTAAPLRSLRVIDMADGQVEMSTRYLADLGAEVIKVEPPGGGVSRRATGGDVFALRGAVDNANKLGVTIDTRTADGRDTLARLLATADIWVTSARHDALAALDLADLRARLPQLVVVSVTDFGLTGPYRDHQATEWVHAAMAGLLCRSGLPGRPPLLPPDRVLENAVAAQISWCTLVALQHRLVTGVGDHLDISLFETAVQVFDPAFGTGPTAGFGRPWFEFQPDRPDVGSYYPVFDCADGRVRIAVLAAPQWRAMWRWLGEPAEFADPRYEQTIERQRAHHRLKPLIAHLFADRAAMDLTEEGQSRGVPIAPVQQPHDIPHTPHFRERHAFTELEVEPGVHVPVPAGYVEIDDVRAGIRSRAPRLGEHTERVLAQLPPLPEPAASPPVERGRPFASLRVIDLGIIVAGAETGRMFADYGADVIRVENGTHPDGSRRPFTGEIAPGFAWGNRNKRSLGLNLRSERGKELFTRLLETADVLLSNFKPSTLDKLGFGPQRLFEINPGLVVAQSSAVGHTGPWKTWMGYGPLVRAVSGLTALWQDPEVPTEVADALTVYPDHVAGRVVATAALAALIGRQHTGRGCRVTCAQAEVVLTALSAEIAAEGRTPGSVRPRGNRAGADAPCGVYPCAGVDQWCVISVRDDADYRALQTVIDLPDLPDAEERLDRRDELDKLVTAWTNTRDGEEVMAALQAVGVPVGPMQRIPELGTDPALRARRAFTALYQPTVPEPLVAERRQFLSERIADPDSRPAPGQGQHTRHICVELLGLTESEVEALMADGVLEEPDPWAPVHTLDPNQGVPT